MRISDWGSDVCSSDLTRFLDVTFAHDRREVADRVVAGELRGFVVIPQDFEQRLAGTGDHSLVQVVTDGSQPNTANFVANYAQGVVQTWRTGSTGEAPSMAITLEPRYWFNPELESRRSLVPGAIAIVMTIIGTMRSEEHTSELQSLMRISYAVFC